MGSCHSTGRAPPPRDGVVQGQGWPQSWVTQEQTLGRVSHGGLARREPQEQMLQDESVTKDDVGTWKGWKGISEQVRATGEPSWSRGS